MVDEQLPLLPPEESKPVETEAVAASTGPTEYPHHAMPPNHRLDKEPKTELEASTSTDEIAADSVVVSEVDTVTEAARRVVEGTNPFWPDASERAAGQAGAAQAKQALKDTNQPKPKTLLR